MKFTILCLTGSPLDNCAVYLLDEEMNPSRESEPGEVWVAGRNLARGYVGGQAPEKFCDNPHAAHPGKIYPHYGAFLVEWLSYRPNTM